MILLLWLLACRDECPSGRIVDCDERCVPAEHLGDGVCDRGFDPSAPRLSCVDLDWDAGDCPAPVVCAADEVEDCAGGCVGLTSLGDGVCDDGAYGVDLSCEAFNYDEGDCLVDGCPPELVADCVGACFSAVRVGNGFCDDGTEYAWGNADFDCTLWNWDAGDCPRDTGAEPVCDPGKVEDCAGVCNPSVRVGNGFCDDGTVYTWGSSDFDCATFGFDGGDCAADTGPVPLCDPGKEVDCAGVCNPSVRIGNGFCDDGTVYPWGSSDFDCATFGFDGGDCAVDTGAVPTCTPPLVEDCAGACYNPSRVGNGFCDDGTVYPWGSSDFDCATFGFDGGDCAVDTGPVPVCTAPLVEDCAGACYNPGRVGNGFCDDGTVYPWGSSDFDCATFGFDGGDCAVDTGPVPVCTPPLVEDCAGACYNPSRVGNGFCDDGTVYPWGSSDFDCATFGFDGGDCAVDTGPVPVCTAPLVEDCAGACYNPGRVGNGFCDDGTVYPWGSSDFDCATFGFDGGDCAVDTGPVPVCTAPLVEDCAGACYNPSRVGNGFCDDGTVYPWGSSDFDCATFGFDGGDCAVDTGPVPVCTAPLVEDCAGACYNPSRVGNGFCDDGTVYPWGSSDFDCATFGFDGGDCAVDTGPVPVCTPPLVEDCAGACYNPSRVGNGFCDDGTVYPWGSSDFDCATFGFDGGDCAVDTGPVPVCTPPLVEDCAGACYNPSRVGNGFCDDGTVYPWGSSDFQCPRFGFDGGDCVVPDTWDPPDTGDTDLPLDSGLPLDTGDTDLPVDTAGP